jgi:hypothetical protein
VKEKVIGLIANLLEFRAFFEREFYRAQENYEKQDVEQLLFSKE